MNATENKSIYVLDTNILFNFSVWMPISLNKSFWDKLEDALKKKEWVLLDVVVAEIKYDDELKKWCEEQNKGGRVTAISDEDRSRGVAINNEYKMIDEATQKSTVDTYLIAFAERNGNAVFSRESPRKTETDLYKIPDVCQKLKVKNIKRPKIFYERIGYKN